MCIPSACAPSLPARWEKKGCFFFCQVGGTIIGVGFWQKRVQSQRLNGWSTCPRESCATSVYDDFVRKEFSRTTVPAWDGDVQFDYIRGIVLQFLQNSDPAFRRSVHPPPSGLAEVGSPGVAGFMVRTNSPSHCIVSQWLKWI